MMTCLKIKIIVIRNRYIVIHRFGNMFFRPRKRIIQIFDRRLFRPFRLVLHFLFFLRLRRFFFYYSLFTCRFFFRRFLFLLLYLKVNGSINEGPFPSGKGQKLSRKDFQPVEGVMGVDRFAVGVRVISAPRD